MEATTPPELYLLAPFVSGVLLSESARSAGSRAMKDECTERVAGTGWMISGVREALLIEVDGNGGNHRVVEPELARYVPAGADAEAIRSLLTTSLSKPVSAVETAFVVGEHGVGVATIRISFREMPQESDVSEMASLGLGHALISELNRQLELTLERLRESLSRTPAMTVTAENDSIVERGSQMQRVLWFHRLWFVSPDDEPRVLAGDFPENSTAVTSGPKGWVLRIGDGSSICSGEAIDAETVGAVVRTLSIAEGYWSVLNEYDSVLVEDLRRYSAVLFDGASEQLTPDFDLHRIATRVSTIDHEGKSLTSTFPPVERKIWEAVETAWRIRSLETAVMTKLDSIKDLDRLRIERSDQRWQRMLNQFAVVLAVAAVISTMIDILAYGLTDDQTGIGNPLRSTVLIFAVALLVAASGWVAKRRSAERETV